jgi:hypothetical protein
VSVGFDLPAPAWAPDGPAAEESSMLFASVNFPEPSTISDLP